MKLINSKYHKLKATIDYLGDEVVMAQAWKKTHSYMRTHNWYADTLALDVSALSLESNVKNWAESATDDSEKLYEIALIPAAKSENWIVDSEKGWCPSALLDSKKEKERIKKPPLRPLAHLTVRDQTWATAAMLCLADVVETEQGDCSEADFFIAQKKHVYSYGNRLLCDWDNADGQAWFRWGNGQVYRKFFTDYQSFLRRPVVIGREISQSHSASENVYVVSLDLAKFYDHIERNKLVKRLKELCVKDGEQLECDNFWQSFEKITAWKWSKKSQNRASELGLDLGKGLPQGLVSAGFYANAYLLNFDRQVGRKIGQVIPGSEGIILHDYCRYVDDLRLVVSIEADEQYDEIDSVLHDWLLSALKKYAGKSLKFNTNKTKVTALNDLDNKGSLSVRIAQLQQDLSGPADRDMLESSMGVLEGLLTLRSDGLPDTLDSTPDDALVRLAKFDHDIRPDTLKRFAANRLETIMRNKRRLDGVISSKNAVESDNESELLAKKLIWAWMQDPSLALVLRKALEIYPSTQIAEPVFDAILHRCSFYDMGTADTISSAMADYLLADIFRCCIDFHGFFQRVDYPVSANPEALMDLACSYAQKALDSKGLPEFVERQALLLLAVNQKPALFSDDPTTIHQHLNALLVGKTLKWQHQLLALYEVASQITGSPNTLAKQLLDVAENQPQKDQAAMLDELAKREGPFWAAVWKRLPKTKITKKMIATLKWAAPEGVASPKPRKQRLSKILSSQQNPFVHESALIKLALALLTLTNEVFLELPLSPAELVLKQTHGYQAWGKLWKPGVEIKFTHESIKSVADPRFQTPSWLNESEDAISIYWIGNILRAAAIGATDFTGSRWKPSSVKSYKGLRTGWYKRRMGMMHAPEALVGEYATLSNWSAELLMMCLQWPGFESTHIAHDDIASINDLESLEGVLKKRLVILNELYCEAVETPALITKAGRPEKRHEEGFRLVTVQQLLPRATAFTVADPTLDSSREKAINRDHLARICQITYRTLRAKLEAENKTSYPGADLIIFPELAIHPDDQDLLKRLADKTQSMIFAGLFFQDKEGDLVNLARWFIPDYRNTGRQWVIRDQGKANLTQAEIPLGIVGYRPCQHIIEIEGDVDGPFRITGSICYDATDLKLASDLKGKTDLFIIVAHNKDVRTFDAMASALNYHMYQHVVVVNKGEFGGSTIQAPYREEYDRLISHAHGVGQISIHVADLDLAAFRRKTKSYKKVKMRPAG